MPKFSLGSKDERLVDLREIELTECPSVGDVLDGIVSPQGNPIKIVAVHRAWGALEIYQFDPSSGRIL